MKITSKVASLREAVSITGVATAKQSTIVSLTRMLIVGQSGACLAYGGNGQQASCTVITDAVSDENGKITVDPSLVGSILSAANAEDTVIMEVKKDKIHMTVGKLKLDMPLYEDDATYPMPAPMPADAQSRMLSLSVLKDIEHAVAKDTTNPIMGNVCVKFGNDKIAAIGLDSHRIALRGEYVHEEPEALIPLSAVDMALKIFGAGEAVQCAVSNSKMWLTDGSTVFITTLAGGEYFNINQMLVDGGTAKIVANRETLLNELRPFMSVSKEVLKLEVTENMVTAKCENTELKVKLENVLTVESINCSAPLKVGLDPEFFADALKSIKEETVTVDFLGEKAPINMKGEGYWEVILPVVLR